MREEKARLKRRVADLTLDEHILQEVIKKWAESSAPRRALVAWIHESNTKSAVIAALRAYERLPIEHGHLLAPPARRRFTIRWFNKA